MTAPPLNLAWKMQLNDVNLKGKLVRPRGMLTKELPQRTLVFDMSHPVITIPERKLGYRFMAAEAWWILEGRNDVASIAPYSKEISRFSDDGETFFGSYGVPFVDQLDYVVQTLGRDLDTRQATMTFWRQKPPITKDVPCTVAIDFKIRNGLLNCHVFMRSSDMWLGVPYDAFNFTMMACRVLELYNQGRDRLEQVRLGTCFLTAASSHLYDRNWPDVEAVLKSPLEESLVTRPVPPYLYGIDEPNPPPCPLIDYLRVLKDVSSDQSRWRWWLQHPPRAQP